MQAGYIPFHRPSIDEREIDAVISVMRSGWLTTGTKCEEFEKRFAEFLGVSHALAVNSCTAALHLALEAIGVGPGDEVLVPTLTFTATAEVVAYLGAKPVLVDSEPLYFNMDPAGLEKHVTSRTKALIPVHFAGHPCDMRAITSFAAHHGIAVIEDAAHALPARYHGANVGTFGRLAAFSFYATKTLTTGEGGMVVCGNEELAHRISVMRLHGMSKDAWKRYQQNGSWFYDVVAPGFKYNLSDLQAAIGIVQLEKAESLRRARERIAERYTRCLQELDGISVPCVSSDVLHAWHLYVIVLRPNALRLDRDAFIEQLTKRGIGCSVHFTPLHMLTYYRDTYGYQKGQFPVAEAYYEGCISLPIYPEMTDDDVDRVIEAVTDVIGRSSRQPRSLRAKIPDAGVRVYSKQALDVSEPGRRERRK